MHCHPIVQTNAPNKQVGIRVLQKESDSKSVRDIVFVDFILRVVMARYKSTTVNLAVPSTVR